MEATFTFSASRTSLDGAFHTSSHVADQPWFITIISSLITVVSYYFDPRSLEPATVNASSVEGGLKWSIPIRVDQKQLSPTRYPPPKNFKQGK